LKIVFSDIVGGAGEGGNISFREELTYLWKRFRKVFGGTVYSASMQDVNGDGRREILLSINDLGGVVLCPKQEGRRTVYTQVGR
jgi:hypothetical protein